MVVNSGARCLIYGWNSFLQTTSILTHYGDH